MTITWTTKILRIKELKEYPNNPRKMTKKEFEKLVRSIKEDGYHQRVMVDSDNTIIGGHQRKKALLASGLSANDEIEVLQPTSELTKDQFDRINIRDNLAYGNFDFDILSSRFDLETLADFGMDENMIIGFDGGDDVSSSDSEEKPEKPECHCQCCKH